jgi:hypothetical protein
MRAVIFWRAALLLGGCAHGSNPTASPHESPAVAAQSQELRSARPEDAPGRAELSPDIITRPHPPHEVSELDHPPATAAKGPRDLDDSAAAVPAVAPPPPSAPAEVALEPTETPAAARVPASPPPADLKRDEARQTPPKLGADIARADAELRERVQRALLESPSLSYTAKHVQVQVEQRDVVLRGEVRNAYERGEIEQIVRAVRGVRSLENKVALINPPTATPRVP